MQQNLMLKTSHFSEFQGLPKKLYQAPKYMSSFFDIFFKNFFTNMTSFINDSPAHPIENILIYFEIVSYSNKVLIDFRMKRLRTTLR